MSSFDELLLERTQEAEQIVLSFLPEEKGKQKTIFKAMNYSVKAGGKRLRPVLMAQAFRFFGGRDMQIIAPFMAAIEMIHTYSLIHDDLPALDNDDYRRGRLTNHKVFGEDMAILAGDALQSYAYEVAAKAARQQVQKDPQMGLRCAQAMCYLTALPGIYGMVGGQVVDVELAGKPIDADTMKFIFELKTGAMIRAALDIGACMGGADAQQQGEVDAIGYNIGMAFQIRDDILDVIGSQDKLGKPVGSDEKNDKTTWVSLFGIDQAQADVRSYSQAALDGIAALRKGADPEDDFLYELTRWLTLRDH